MKKLAELYQAILNKQLYAAILIGIVCLSTHGVTILNDYNLDDNLVTQNHRLTSKGISAIPEIYRSPYYQDDMGYSYGYRPTTLASFAIEKSLFGESATVSHAVNLALYLATCLLIFFLVKRVFPDKIDVALFAALLFTVHPIHTEVVASIKNRDEILALLFALTGCFVLVRPKRWWVNLLIASAFFFLSVSSKMSAVNIILLLALIPAYPKPFFKDAFLLFFYGLSLHFVLDGRNLTGNISLKQITTLLFGFLLVRLVIHGYALDFFNLIKKQNWRIQNIKIFVMSLIRITPRKELSKKKLVAFRISQVLMLFLSISLVVHTYNTDRKQVESLSKVVKQFIEDDSANRVALHWVDKNADKGKRPFDFVEHPLDPSGFYGTEYGTAAVTLNRYLGKLFVPYPLGFYYGFDEIEITNLLSFQSFFFDWHSPYPPFSCFRI